MLTPFNFLPLPGRTHGNARMRLIASASPSVVIPPEPRAFCPGPFPRVLGTLLLRGMSISFRRFIPMRVGNTTRISRFGTATAVHPHARGEHGIGNCGQVFHDGSSPRAWGTHLPSHRAPSFLGSSPRAWGTRNTTETKNDTLRFIPTRVGNTRDESRDHGVLIGSSPRAWGTREFSRAAGRPAVHPHARGEHKGRSGSFPHRAGSSPRAWGTLFLYFADLPSEISEQNFYRLAAWPRSNKTGAKPIDLIRNVKDRWPGFPEETTPASRRPVRQVSVDLFRGLQSRIQLRCWFARRSQHCRPQFPLQLAPKCSREP